MTEVGTLAITLPTLVAIFGAILAWQNYKLNKKKADKSDSKEDLERKAQEDKEKQENALRLLSIEKDVQYIRVAIDKFEARGEDHEKRITSLENKCKSFAGGKQK